MSIIENVKVISMQPRIGTDPRNGMPAQLTEIFYEFTRDGVYLRALTREPWPTSDTDYNRARERENFIRRMGKAI